MSTDRIDILDALAKLSPAERLRLEDMVVQAILRDDDARREAADPVGYREATEAAEAFARTLGDGPLSPEAREGLRRACAEMAREVLRRGE